MKKIMAILITVFLGAIIFTGTASAVDVFDYTDMRLDPMQIGEISSDLTADIDILSLHADFTSEPYVLEMTVDGVIVLEDAEATYQYKFYLDEDGDDNYDVQVMSMGDTGMIMIGNTPTMIDAVSGEGTNKIRIEVSSTDLPGISSVADVYGETMVAEGEGSLMDHINLQFTGGSSSGDAEDNEPINTDDMYTPDVEYKNSADPETENPTDSSISVNILDSAVSMDEEGDYEEFEESIDGTAAGEIVYGAIAKVFYMKDGSVWDVEWTMGPMNLPRFTSEGRTIEMYFKGTGDDGKDDWSEWGHHLYMKRPSVESGKIEIDSNGTCVDFDEVEKVKVFVRVFSDEELTKWNQDSIDLTSEYLDPSGDGGDDDDMEGEDESEEKTPGFGMALAVGSIFGITAVIVLMNRRKI